MFLVGLISWWYGRGWLEQWRRSGGMLLRTLEFFSIGQLAATLFSPFRQISVGTKGVGLAGVMSALIDKLMSRIIGAIIRFGTILIGTVLIGLQSMYVLMILLFWWIVPVLPFVGIIAFMIGWMPYGQ